MSTESAAAENESGARPDTDPAAAASAEAEPVSADGAGAGAAASEAGTDDAEAAAGTDGAEDREPEAAAAGADDAEDLAGRADGAEDSAEGAEAADAGATPDEVDAEAEDNADDADDAEASSKDGAEKGADVSEAEAELAAQREFRERIAERKAAKEGPIDAGTKLSGTAADLLAAVRAVESGEKPAAAPVLARPEPEPRRDAPAAAPAEPVRRPQAAVQAGANPEAVDLVRAVLAEGGAPESLAGAAAAALGEGAGDELRADPWQLLRVSGVRPEQADGFARALLGAECGPDDERRGRAVTVWLLEQAANAGHTALDLSVLAEALGKQGVPDAEEAVQSAVAEGDALIFHDPLEEAPIPAPAAEEDGEEEEAERPVRVLVGLERYALAEESLADGLARLLNAAPKDEGSATAGLEEAAAAERGTTAELIRAIAAHRLVLHTGGEAARAEPIAAAAAAGKLGLRVCVAAHGADGRRRAAELLGPDAPETATATVAGLLAQAEGPGLDRDGAFALDVLVVLDAPQLDVGDAAMLVELLADGTCLVLSGDPGTLWSAGPGRVFADVAAAEICPRIASRTPDFGPIGELVSGIGIGELNQVEAPGKEVVIVPVRDPAEAIHRTVQLVADSVPRAIGVPAEQTQVITPGHGGAAGTRALNVALKERLNPGPGRFGGFDPGDRAVYVTGRGRIRSGVVVGADAEGLRLECDGAPVLVPKEQVEQGAVRHGWAVTGHQAVGVRWPAAVVVLPGDATQALSRPWVYTAFGRGERHLSVVHGADTALPRAVSEIAAKPRTTRLRGLVAAQVPQP
ncbi:DNA helicase RecD [Streptomyces sp. NBC_00006]|uniref:helix-hairpin-helix domain-containing protein n=1 Tax=Streptomyces sp. NBC_00006 TaxID=2975619 RepID=UPI0022544455|nr:helix-hairpin-helix domain-containing protein [Streptomyces sp. NBC_00006]MCX5534578.1 DNA helicase RecD [Streptomyces sp. NBC_00006]